MINIKLSVHELVDFILRTGDIDDRYFNNETMEEGSYIHKMYQNKQGNNYLSEVSLKRSFIYQDYCFIINGRCDGIILGKSVTIDEIKSTNNESLEDFFLTNEAWHLGQAEVYALIYLLDHDLENINVRLTYLSQIKKKDKLIKEYFYTKEELINKVNSYFEKYLIFYKNDLFYKEKLHLSLDRMIFPYQNKRKGQDEISDITYNAILNNEKVFIEAATGIGKTISTLWGALKGLKEDKINRIFYLTAKNSGFTPVLDQISKLKDQKIDIRTTIIYSKEKSCINKSEIKRCNPDECEFAKGYYSKLNEILLEMIKNHSIFDDKTILEYALKYEICPFELSLDLAKVSSIIVCDYNYCFHPISYLKRYFDEGSDKSYIGEGENPDYKFVFLIDESHNLVTRSRAMYSSKLTRGDFEKALKELSKGKNLAKFKNAIKSAKTTFDLFEKGIDESKKKEVEYLDEVLYSKLVLINEQSKDFKKLNYIKKKKDTEDLLLKVYQFLTIYQTYDDNFKLYYLKENDGVSLNLICLDASRFINKFLYNKSAIFFSGTLTPIDYYKKVTLGSSDYKDYSFESPYESNNLNLMIDNTISLFYKDRDRTIGTIANEILNFVSYKVGNYLIFLPSFQYLKLLKSYFEDLNYNFFFQGEISNKKEEKEIFFNFFNKNKEMNIAFCVLGGSYSEGIEIKNSLDGICILGVGLPSICIENEYLKEYFNDNNLNGFDFAYTNPGINKVMQAIGRVIRSEEDRGSVLLIDKRYGYSTYKQIFQEKYKTIKKVDSNNISSYLKEFYKI